MLALKFNLALGHRIFSKKGLHLKNILVLFLLMIPWQCKKNSTSLSSTIKGQAVSSPKCYHNAIDHPILPVALKTNGNLAYSYHTYDTSLQTEGSNFAFDFTIPIGTDVVAPADGTIRLTFSQFDLLTQLKDKLATETQNGSTDIEPNNMDLEEKNANLNRLRDEIEIITNSGFISGALENQKHYINYGYYIVLQWSDPILLEEKLVLIESLFLHLNEINVTAGQTVKAGEFLGRSGASGFATGPHLHYQVQLAGGGSYWKPSVPIRLSHRSNEQSWGRDSNGCLTQIGAPIRPFNVTTISPNFATPPQ